MITRIYLNTDVQVEHGRNFVKLETKVLPPLDVQLFDNDFYKYCRDNKLSDFVISSAHEGVMKSMQQALAVEAIREVIEVK